MAKKKPVKNPKVARTRAAGTMTEAKYWGKVREALRKSFAYWKPAQLAMKAAECGTRVNPKTGKDRKIYRCAMCGGADYPELMQIDHIEPCGSLLSLEDLAPFLERLTCEDTSKFQVLHKTCHQAKTNEARRPIGKPGNYPKSAIIGVDYASGQDQTVVVKLPVDGFVPPGDKAIEKQK